MTDNIRKLDPPGPDASVVEFLQEMVEQAGKGAAESASVVIVFGDGTVGSGYTTGKNGEDFRLLGGLTYAQARLAADI